MVYRIGYFIESFYPNNGGGEKRALNLLKRLKGFSVDVYTINFGYQEEERINNLKIHRILNADKRNYFRDNGRNILIAFKYASKIKDLIKNENFDLYIFDQFPYFHFTKSENLIKNKIKIVQVHEILKGYYKNTVKELALEHYERKMYQSSNLNIVTSLINKEKLITSYKIQEEKIRIIPNGIQRFEGKNDGDGIVFVGRNTKDKNINAIVEIARKLKKYDFTLVTDLNGTNLSNMKIKSNLSDEDLHNEYRKSKIFVTASLREGFSIASLEAMGFGLPVIYLKTELNKPMQEIIKDGVSGYGCLTIDEMAEKIKFIYENYEEWKRMSKNAIEIAKNYTWDLIAENYEKLLLSIMGENK